MYEYSYSAGMEEFEALFGSSVLMSLLSSIPGAIIGIVVHILIGVGLYTIAKRRGIRNGWLAFIPVLNVWILGSISDQYRHVVQGQIKARRKVLLGTNIAYMLICCVVLVLCGTLFARIFANMAQLETMNDEQAAAFAMEMVAPMVGIFLLFLPLLVLAIVQMVFYYIALYDVYKSCDPSNAVLYLVLSIVVSFLFGNICQPIFLMICRNKDEGMAPLYAPPQPPFGYSQPAWQPVQPEPQPPTWQPVQPPAEPWENQE